MPQESIKQILEQLSSSIILQDPVSNIICNPLGKNDGTKNNFVGKVNMKVHM